MRKSTHFVEIVMKHRQVTITLTAILLLYGLISFITMPRSENPVITVRQAMIQAALPGATETQVESQLTEKIEEYIFSFPEINKAKTTSISKTGISLTTVELQEWVENPQIFFSKLQNNIDHYLRPKLPSTAIGPSVNNNFGEVVTHIISLSAPSKYSSSKLSSFLDLISNRLRGLPEVSAIRRYGEQEYEINISVNASKINSYPFDILHVANIINRQNVTLPMGDYTPGRTNMPLFSDSRYSDENAIGDQLIFSNGSTDVRLKDIATINRRISSPTAYVRTGNDETVILSIEVQRGQNVVAFGHKLNKVLTSLRQELPDDVRINSVVDSSEFVQTTVDHFMKEFYFAVAAVIIVILMLLPFRIALVAGSVAPITIIITFGMLHFCGIELHQVTLAGLVIVLGMVVDDALVIVDHYKELLDKGISRWDAAWKSAAELFVPILAATLVIAFAFIPLSFFLDGLAGEFIAPLPATVSIALFTSLAVALLVTPLMCYFFIPAPASTDGKRRSGIIMDALQRFYDKAVNISFRYPKLTMAAGAVSVIAAALIGINIEQELFPKTDINKFNVEIWMKDGCSLSSTAEVVNRVEEILRNDERVVDLVSFYGTSAPRFNTTYNPEPQRENYAQIFVSTKDIQTTRDMCQEYVAKFENLVTNGYIRVRELSFNQTPAPVEFRIYYHDIQKLREIASEVKGILSRTEGTNWIRDDFGDPYIGLKVIPHPGSASDVGVINESINRLIAFTTQGVPVSEVWEGKRPVNIRLRLDSGLNNMDALDGLEITSISGNKIRLSQIADIGTEWHDVIRHRNGDRCLTVMCESQLGIKASKIIKNAKDEIMSLDLPVGARIEIGGEAEAVRENIPGMIISLGVSLVLIFITLLFQFKNIVQVLIILATFPLSLLGGMIGLYITNNPAGFTAFMGIISLAGVVVRNGNILVDYSNSLVANGYSVKEAAINAAKRRMRPIVLTSFAAAVGVLPMVLSGSSLWSPLGSVLAFGLIVSMGMTLFVVPVLYASFVKKSKSSF